MVKGWRLGLIGVVASALLGCGGDATGPNSESVVGTWRATKLEAVSVANPSIKEELVSQGFVLTIAFSAGNTFAATSQWPGLSAEGFNGAYSETGSRLTMTQTDPPPTLAVSFARSVNGNTLVLSGGDSTYDFGNGTELAKLNWTFVRQ